MKIVVIGGTGLIGSRVVSDLVREGHQAVAASPETGVNTLTGEGLGRALEGADVAVDVTNSHNFDERAATDFFTNSTNNLLAAERAAGVRHHVALSIVGSDRPSEIGYFHAKAAQERLIKESRIPYTIVHATQFFEFLKGIADDATAGDEVRLPPVQFQPMAADDVALRVAEVAASPPLNATVETAGPERFRFDEFVRHGLAAMHDPRRVVSDPNARYFGAIVNEQALVPLDAAVLGKTRFDDWLSRRPAA